MWSTGPSKKPWIWSVCAFDDDPVGAPVLAGQRPAAARSARAAVLLVLPGVRVERQDRGDPLGAATLESVDHDQLLHQPLVQRRGMGLQHERIAAAHRLFEPHEDLTVGEVAGGLRGDVDVELLGDLLGQLRMRATGEEHHVLAVFYPVGTHSAPSPVGIDFGLIVRSTAGRTWPGCQNTNGRSPAHVVLLSSGSASSLALALARRAASAAADPGRLRSTQPSILRCGPADTASAPGGTSSRTTVPAPV